jgi:hypothetical protein
VIEMRRLRVSCFLLACAFAGLTQACQQRVKNSRAAIESKTARVDENTIDILKFKYRVEYFSPDSLGLKFSSIFVRSISDSKYEVKIQAEQDCDSDLFYKKHYLIMGIYPYDKDLSILHSERIKYGFERFDFKLRKNDLGNIETQGIISSGLKKARAVTLSLMEYKTGNKIKEVVMLDVKLL